MIIDHQHHYTPAEFVEAPASGGPTVEYTDGNPSYTFNPLISDLDAHLAMMDAAGGYAGPKLRGALDKIGDWRVQIIKRSDSANGFQVLPRRWVVERTFAWLGRCRRLAKDWEKSIASAEAWLLIAHIRLVTRRIASYCYHT